MSFEQFLKIVSRDPDPRSYFQILEKHPEYVNKKDSQGRTALFYAAESEHGDVIRNLVGYHGADIFVKDKTGKTIYDLVKDNPELSWLIDDVLKPLAAERSRDFEAMRMARPNLPDDVLGVVSENLTGIKGSVAQQRKSLRSAVGKGRKRKTAKRRRTRLHRKTK